MKKSILLFILLLAIIIFVFAYFLEPPVEEKSPPGAIKVIKEVFHDHDKGN